MDYNKIYSLGISISGYIEKDPSLKERGTTPEGEEEIFYVI